VSEAFVASSIVIFSFCACAAGITNVANITTSEANIVGINSVSLVLIAIYLEYCFIYVLLCGGYDKTLY
jgi:hypothetical protein